MKNLLALLKFIVSFVIASFTLSYLFYSDEGYISSLFQAFKGFAFVCISVALMCFVIAVINDYKYLMQKIPGFLYNILEIPRLFIVAFVDEIIKVSIGILIYISIVYGVSEFLDINFYKVLLASVAIVIPVVYILVKFVNNMIPAE